MNERLFLVWTTSVDQTHITWPDSSAQCTFRVPSCISFSVHQKSYPTWIETRGDNNSKASLLPWDSSQSSLPGNEIHSRKAYKQLSLERAIQLLCCDIWACLTLLNTVWWKLSPSKQLLNNLLTPTIFIRKYRSLWRCNA